MLAEIGLLPVALDEFRLVIEEIDVAGGPGHEELHDALGLRLEVRKSARWFALATRPARQHAGQRDATQAATGLPEKLATIHWTTFFRKNSGRSLPVRRSYNSQTCSLKFTYFLVCFTPAPGIIMDLMKETVILRISVPAANKQAKLSFPR